MSSAPPVQRPAFASLRSGSPATRAYARALAATMRELRRHEERVLTDGSPGPVHDFRVILRMLRSLLWAAQESLGSTVHAYYRMEFRWLGQRTAAVRDLDALDGALPDYLAEVSGSPVALATALKTALATHRARALADLRDSLRSARYRTLQTRWRASMRTLHADARTAAAPVITLGEDLGARVADLHARLRRYRRRKLVAPAVVHAFRKDCKRLRDLLVAFAGVWSPTANDESLAQCRRVLARCGDCWDLEVHRGLLQRLVPLNPSLTEGDWADALTDAQRTRSTRAMHAIRAFQRAFELPALRRSRGRRRRDGAG